MFDESLILVVDMYGCPNRCKHCWIGHMPNKQMDADADVWIVDYFKPYFKHIILCMHTKAMLYTCQADKQAK